MTIDEINDYSLMNGVDNCIEFIKGSDRATVTFSQERYVSKIRKLAEQYPDEVEIVAENRGSMMAHVPVSYVVIRHPKVLSEEQREKAAERLSKMRRNKN